MDIWPAELAEKYRLDDLMIIKKENQPSRRSLSYL
jgi:hypothetical protein